MKALTHALLFLIAGSLAACAQDQPPEIVAERIAPVPSEEAAGSAAELDVRYLANEGFAIRHGNQAVLIDSLFADLVSGYPTVPVDVRGPLERGEGEWQGVQVAIASHFHGDHFDAAAVGRFLVANPQAHFVSTPQAAASFQDANPGRDDLLERFHALLPAPGTTEVLELAGIRIEALNLTHGPRNPPVENLGVVVTLGDRRFIHFGDTEAKMPDFEPYLELLAEPDVALLPFWFLTSEWRIDLVRDLLRPGRIVAAHMPMADAPAGYFGRWGSHDGVLAIIADAFPDAWVPQQSGEAMPSSDLRSAP